MNIDAKNVIRFLRPLFHLFQMLTRWYARNAKAKRWRNRYQPLPAGCPAIQVARRQEPFPAARPNQVSPEHDIQGPGLAPLTNMGCRKDAIQPAAFFCESLQSRKEFSLTISANHGIKLPNKKK
jgi:hypothetical protein